MLQKEGVIEALPNTLKQTQTACQNEGTRNMAQMKEQIKIPKKELNKMVIRNL